MKSFFKILFSVSILFLLSLSFYSCMMSDSSGTTVSSSDDDDDDDVTPTTELGDTSSLYINLSEGKLAIEDSDNDSDWYTIGSLSTGAIGLSENTLFVYYTEDDDGNVTDRINVKANNYAGNLSVYLEGTCTSGGLRIQTNTSYTVSLYLDSVSMTSSSYPCIDMTKGGAAKVYLSGTNTLTDGREYGTGYGSDYSTEGSNNKGTLYCKGDLTIAESSSGSLTVSQAYKNCIASKGILTINSGTYTLTSEGKNGLMGDSSVVINDGTITYNGTGAISTSQCRKANFIKTDTDDSTSSVYIKGGSLTADVYNGKGINSSKVYISGGSSTFTVTGETGFTSDNNKSGTYTDADGETCSGSITFAPEGIEAASIMQITGGRTEVTATDDALNVSDDGGSFTISGGALYAYSTGGDAVDSNGNVYVKGGLVVAYAPTGSEDALDCGDNYSIKITGGVVAGTCGSTNGLSSMSTSNQKLLYFSGSSSSSNRPGSSSSSSSISAVAVEVDDEYVYAYELPSSSYGLFFMTCPSFTSSSSSSYTVYTDADFSGGSDFNGLYASDDDTDITEMPTISASSKKTPTVK